MHIREFITEITSRSLMVLVLVSASAFAPARSTSSAASHIDSAQLQLRWVFHSRNSTFTGAVPAIANGVIYISTSSDIYAIDAVSGGMIWHYNRQASGSQSGAFTHITRSILIHGNSLFILTEDAHFLALDTRSGNLLWDVAYTSSDGSCSNAHTTIGTYNSEIKTISWRLALPASIHAEGCVITLNAATGKLVHPLHISPEMTPVASVDGFFLAADPFILKLHDFAGEKTLWSFNLGQKLESQMTGYSGDGRLLIVVAAGKDLFLFGQDLDSSLQ